MLILYILVVSFGGAAYAEKVGQVRTPPTDRKVVTRILAWGENNVRQLGSVSPLPGGRRPVWATAVEEVLQGFDVVQIDGGPYRTCMLRSDKTVWCWGTGGLGKVQGLPPIQSVEMGGGYTFCAKAEDATTWCWEREESTAHKVVPPSIPGLVDFYHGVVDVCALTEQKKMWCWGERYGDVPIELSFEKTLKKMVVGGNETCAIDGDDVAWCWAASRQPHPHKVFDQKITVEEIATGNYRDCFLTTSGDVWCSKRADMQGVEEMGQMQISKGKPLDGIVKLAGAGGGFCALRKDGAVWCWDGLEGDPLAGGNGAPSRVKSTDAVCNIGYVADIGVGLGTAYAIVKGTDEDFRKLETECITD